MYVLARANSVPRVHHVLALDCISCACFPTIMARPQPWMGFQSALNTGQTVTLTDTSGQVKRLMQKLRKQSLDFLKEIFIFKEISFN